MKYLLLITCKDEIAATIMRHTNQGAIYFRIFSDVIILWIGFFLAAILSQRGVHGIDFYLLVTLSITWYFTSRMSNLYEEFRALRFIDELLILIPNTLAQFLTSVVVQFSLNEHHYQRKFAFLYPLVIIVLLSLKKYVSKKYVQHIRRKGLNMKNILIIGVGDVAMNFWDTIQKNPQFGYHVTGFLDESKPLHLNGLYKGKIQDLELIINAGGIDEVIVAVSEYNHGQLQNIINITDRLATRARIIPNYFQFNSSRFKMEMFGEYPLVTVRNEPLEQFHSQMVKRIIDICLSTLAIILVFSWLFPIIAILIKLDSKGPVFFNQCRWGKGNSKFLCFKFRTMTVNRDAEEGKFQQTTKNDSRITSIGSFLRKTNFDELPQFFNVFMGDMSVVGPRPHADLHNIETKDQIEGYLIRHWVKPGITGWAQANGYRGETQHISAMQKRVEFDIWYIENWTPWLDVKIVGMTVYSLVKGDLMAY